MNWTLIGICPKCGAPIYVPTAWWSVLPPPPHYTCNCNPRSITVYKSTTNVR